MSSSQLLTVLAVVALLSGCADPSAPSDTTPSSSSAATGPETGAIGGSITNDELVPIPDARIQIVGATGAPQEAFTDDEGAYLIQNLPVGRYQLFATHVGHRDAAPKFAEVIQGETAEANFQLDVLRIQSAYVSILPYSFYYNLAWCFPEEFGEFNSGIYCQGLGWDQANVTHQFIVDESSGPLMTLVHEMEWTNAAPVCQPGMKADLYSPEQATLPANGAMSDPARSSDNPFHWENPTVTSPTKIYVPREGSEDDAMLSPKRTELNGGKPIVAEGKWAVLHWMTHATGPAGLPVPVGCTVEERLNGYLSLFYVEAAPGPDWSAFSG